MRWLVLAIVLRAAVANACDFDADECGPYHPWSWTPLVGIQAAYSANDHGQAVADAELRLRFGSYEHPSVFAYSLAVESANGKTLDPQILFGYDFVGDELGSRDRLEMSSDTHVALGGGRSFGPTDRTFAVAQLGFGVIFDRPSGTYQGPCNERRTCEHEMLRHTTQADVVLELRVTAQGDARLSAGLEFDPIRIWSALTGW